MQPVILKGARFSYQVIFTFERCDGIDINDVPTPKSNWNKEGRVINDLGELEITIDSDNQIAITFNINFSGIPGRDQVSITMDFGRVTTERKIPFDIIGVAIYQSIPNGQIRFFSGQTTEILRNEDVSSSNLIVLDSSVYNGESGASSLPKENLMFSVPDDLPIKWNANNCELQVTGSEVLDHNCALGFSLDFNKFFMFMPSSTYSSAPPARINITWQGLHLFETQTSLGVGIDNSEDDVTEPEPDGEYKDVLTYLQLDTRQSSTTSNLLIIIISVVACLVVVGIIVFRICLYRKRKRNNSGPGKQPKFKRFSTSGIENFLRGETPSAHGTAGRTVGVFEDPLSSGQSQIPTVNNYPTTRQRSNADNDVMLNPLQTPSENHPNNHRMHGIKSPEENDSEFPPAEPVDESLIAARQHSDKSVTKLVLPRDFSRGVELESSTDGASERDLGDAEKSDSDDEREHQGKSTEDGETDAAGTVVVDHGVGSSGGEGLVNMTPIDAAYDRIKKLDKLLGPASRGLVGRHGEPIAGSAGPSSTDDDSRREPDSAIMTLSTLS